MEIKEFFGTRYGIIVAGALIGIVASTLQYLGNPGNMGFCIACFERDIAGALGLQQASTLQYLRPEIVGLILGALLIAVLANEYQSRGGSGTMIRFFLGFFAMIGALAFLGCPWRAFIRIAGGDLNAIAGILGLIVGISIGVLFIRYGYNLGRAKPHDGPYAGMMLPAALTILLLLLIFQFPLLNSSVTGPGSMHPAIIISLGAGLLVGIIAQRSRFCTMGAIRDTLLIREWHLLSGLLVFTLAVFLMNLIYGQFNPGFEGQPIASTDQIWNFTGMVLAGLCFALAGGCPGRQLILSGEGNTDSAVFVIGMIGAGAFAHNFATAASPAGIGTYTAPAVILGLIFCLIIGIIMTPRLSRRRKMIQEEEQEPKVTSENTYLIDTRGLSCPKPILNVSDALIETTQDLKILIDDDTIKTNVMRTLKKRGLKARLIHTDENGVETYIVTRNF